MKTKAVRLYGKDDLRLEEFELPQMKDDEILAKVFSDDICMSTYKAGHAGIEHKRVPDDVAVNPVIVGHEFAGEIVKVGAKWQDEFKPGEKFSIQPAINYEGGPVGTRLFLQVLRRRCDLHHHPQRGDGEGMPLPLQR